MSLQITVRGSAQEHFPAERATLELAVAVEGPEKQEVFDRAVSVQEPLVEELRSLVDRGAVNTWTSDRVGVSSHHPWQGDRQAESALHVARLHVTAEFSDFERLGGFIGHWASQDGVEVRGVTWDVSAKNRRLYESEVRKAAVDDAVGKAQAYADAVRRGRVSALQLADPGMLDGAPVQAQLPMARMASADAAAEGGVTLEPGEIVIGIEVDARFSAE